MSQYRKGHTSVQLTLAYLSHVAWSNTKEAWGCWEFSLCPKGRGDGFSWKRGGLGQHNEISGKWACKISSGNWADSSLNNRASLQGSRCLTELIHGWRRGSEHTGGFQRVGRKGLIECYQFFFPCYWSEKGGRENPGMLVQKNHAPWKQSLFCSTLASLTQLPE